MTRGIFTYLVTCLLAVSIGFVNAGEPEKLVGASDAAPGQYPYSVSFRLSNVHFCGGAIITEQHIITAAHCITYALEHDLEELTIVSGTNSLKYGGQSHKIAAMYAHPEHKTSWYADVGIVKLAKPMQFNALQKKINLPTKKVVPGTFGVITGWGRTSVDATEKASENLQKLYLRIISKDDCVTYLGNSIKDNMICTLNDVDIGTCSGDSGGPLVQKDEIVGVVAGGIPCALGLPDVFADVYYLLPFIKTALTY